MNKVGPRSQMYEWISMTWNPLAGECLHKCYGPFGKYCSTEHFKQKYTVHDKKYGGKYRLVEHELRQNLYKYGKGTVFVENMGDLFEKDVPWDYIAEVLKHCCKYPLNTYLFQSKNPGRFMDLFTLYPPFTIFGTTIETDEYPDGCGSEAPAPKQRAADMTTVPHPRMVSVEPVMDFDTQKMLDLITMVAPKFVSIGADSKNRDLPEPSKEKIRTLERALKERGIEVRLKKNLKRIILEG